MKREKRIIITLSTDEWESIKATASNQGLSVSSFIRRAALGYVEQTKPEVK